MSGGPYPAVLSTMSVSAKDLSHKAFYVPESMSVVKLMRELLERKTHMCIVVNEFGGTIGIATFEDCVEEIVGEIYDEKEVEIFERTGFIKEVAPDVYNVDYRSTVQELGETIGVVQPARALLATS